MHLLMKHLEGDIFMKNGVRFCAPMLRIGTGALGVGVPSCSDEPNTVKLSAIAEPSTEMVAPLSE